MHGRNLGTDYQCCPHGITLPQGPPDQCCVDDIEKTPYRIEYLKHVPSPDSTLFYFGVQVGGCARGADR